MSLPIANRVGAYRVGQVRVGWGGSEVVGGLIIQPTSITSSESFGTATVTLTTQALLPSSVSSSEAFGGALILPGVVTITPVSIGSTEAVGSPELVGSELIVVEDGIVSVEAFGLPYFVYAQVVQLDNGIGSNESFGIAFVSDGLEVVIPVTNRGTYQRVADYLKGTGKYVSWQNNDIIVEWLKSEGIDKEQFNDLFFEYWKQKGYGGAYNDKWKSWRNDT